LYGKDSDGGSEGAGAGEQRLQGGRFVFHEVGECTLEPRLVLPDTCCPAYYGHS
jgi:hypothetical protein